MRKSKEEKALDAKLDEAFKVACDRVQISIFDIATVMNAGKRAHASGNDILSAMKETIEQVRKN
jgi:xanthine dehydrogenase molybdopterin-binding subunit B